MTEEEILFFYRVLSAIKANLQDFVIIGGFASYLYQFHEWAGKGNISPLFTKDIDIASNGEVPVRGGKIIHEALKSDAGLKVDFIGHGIQKKTRYFPEDKRPNLYVEFLAPLIGPERERDGEDSIIESVQDRLNAEKLRYLDLLFKEPLKIDTASIKELDSRPGLDIKVPHPSMYVMQKMLISDRRRGERKYNDFVYVYQTLVVFRNHLLKLARAYEELIENAAWAKWYRRFRNATINKFDGPYREGPVEAARILARQGVTREMVSASVMEFVNNCPEKIS